MQKKIQSHLRTCIRYGIATGRIADNYNERIANSTKMVKKMAGIMICIESGSQCTLAGYGPIFDKFMETGKIENFSGFGNIPAHSKQEHFHEAPLRVMTFANTYNDNFKEFRKSKHHSCYI